MSNLSCSTLSYDNTLRNYFPLPLADTYIIFILFPLTIISTAINLLFFWKVKSSRQPPADILFFGTVFGVFRMVSYFSTDIYDQVYPGGQGQPIPGNFGDFCTGTGFIALFAEIGAFTYNIAFSFLYVFKIRNPLKKWVNQNREVHIICWIITAVTTGILYLTGQIGLSILGVCGLRVSKGQAFIGAAQAIMYLFILFFSSVIFLKYLRTISKEDEKSIVFFKFYFVYLITVSLDKILEHACWLVLGFNCNSNTPIVQLYVFVTICNFTILIIPILITIIILTHPEMNWSSIKIYLKQICRKEQEIDRKSFYDELITTYRGSIQLQTIEKQGNKKQNTNGLLSKIKQRNRACLLSTILGCVSIHQSVSTHDACYNWNFQDRIEFTLTKETVSYYPRIFLKSLPVLQLHFIAYSPPSFNILLKQCEISNISWELKPINNEKQIFQNAQMDGGASGQFFFFNHTKSIIIKTITSLQLQVLTSRLKSFTQHFSKHPESFIVRLMGVFSIVNPQNFEKINFIMMGNLLRMIPRKYATRIYDLKGSTYQRQVVKDYEQIEDYDRTMKDIDFLKLQQKIWVSEPDSDHIKKVLIQDALFLSELGLIDYSLIIIKVAFDQYQKNTIRSKTVNFNPKNMFRSTKQKGIVYIIGIIDFLQTWNIRKKGQNWFKSIFNKSQGISSQDPKFYFERFSKNLVEKIFP